MSSGSKRSPALAPACSAVIEFSKSNNLLSGYFDLVKVTFSTKIYNRVELIDVSSNSDPLILS